jgi:hypothetical protein
MRPWFDDTDDRFWKWSIGIRPAFWPSAFPLPKEKGFVAEVRVWSSSNMVSMEETLGPYSDLPRLLAEAERRVEKIILLLSHSDA